MIEELARLKESIKIYIDKKLASIPTAEQVAALVIVKDGKAGKDGKDGERGEKGKDGEPGINGTDGKDGTDGNDGKDGTDGNDGKDAAQIEILPFIDTEKNYPRGTFAIHNGGLFRSFQQTNGLHGFECIVNGIASLEIAQDEERGIFIKSALSNGVIIEKKIELPVMIYRGVWKPSACKKGDVVTWGGSLWHCNSDTEEKPGEGSKDWTLSVKKGRDGKDTVTIKHVTEGVKLHDAS